LLLFKWEDGKYNDKNERNNHDTNNNVKDITNKIQEEFGPKESKKS